MWEKTVMSDEARRKDIVQKSIFWLPVNPHTIEERKTVCLLRHTAKAQAEITGEIAYKEGIKTVVEWVETNWWDRKDYPEWQNFKKENGL